METGIKEEDEEEDKRKLSQVSRLMELEVKIFL
jgi:hypothetical protein